MSQLLKNRYQELADEADKLKSGSIQKRSEYRTSYTHIENNALLEWTVKATNLIELSCGAGSGHHQMFIAAGKASSFDDHGNLLSRMRAVFNAARSDFEGGYLTSLRKLVHAEVFSDELDQASVLLQAGYIAPAAVVAGVILETNLRNLCTTHGLPAGSMDRMNADLAKAGQYNVLTQKKITALAAIRNSAAHGKVEEFNAQDVKNMIQSITDLIEAWLS
jgi:hypothetical protein